MISSYNSLPSRDKHSILSVQLNGMTKSKPLKGFYYPQISFTKKHRILGFCSGHQLTDNGKENMATAVLLGSVRSTVNSTWNEVSNCES